MASTIAEPYEDREYYQYKGPLAPLTSDGMVMDTPEVAHARAAHLALHAETMARLRKMAQNDYETYENNEMSYVPQTTPDPMEVVAQKRQRQRTYPPEEEEEDTPPEEACETCDPPEVNQTRSSVLKEKFQLEKEKERKSRVAEILVRRSSES